MNKKLKKVFGFTLIEVLVTATIIAVLTAAAAVSYSSVNKRSRDARRKSDIEQLRAALEQSRSDNGYYVMNYSSEHLALLRREIPKSKDGVGHAVSVLGRIAVPRVYAAVPPGGLTPSPSDAPAGVTFPKVSDELTGLVTAGYLPALPKDPGSGDYYFKKTHQNATDLHYYGYCLCAYLDTIASEQTSNTCQDDSGNTMTLPATCNYGRRNP